MDLTTTYLGLDLRTPLVASASPLSQNVDGVRRLADSGVGAVVLFSLFEEQLRAEVARETALLESHENAFAEALDYFPATPITTRSAAYSYLSLVERGAKAIDVPLIASLNGSDLGGWTHFAEQLEEAGASALELNIYFTPGDLTMPGDRVIARHLDIVAAVRGRVRIPVSVKMSPFFANPGNVALQIVDAGADGLVLFNRWQQPDIDIDTLQVATSVELSHPAEGRLPRTWIAALRHHTRASLAATSGVETADDIVKYLLAGADVVMTTSSLLRHGVSHVGVLLAGLEAWMTRKEFTSVDAVRGLLAVPTEIRSGTVQRAGYVAVLEKGKELYGPFA